MQSVGVEATAKSPAQKLPEFHRKFWRLRGLAEAKRLINLSLGLHRGLPLLPLCGRERLGRFWIHLISPRQKPSVAGLRLNEGVNHLAQMKKKKTTSPKKAKKLQFKEFLKAFSNSLTRQTADLAQIRDALEGLLFPALKRGPLKRLPKMRALKGSGSPASRKPSSRA